MSFSCCFSASFSLRFDRKSLKNGSGVRDRSSLDRGLNPISLSLSRSRSDLDLGLRGILNEAGIGSGPLTRSILLRTTGSGLPLVVEAADEGGVESKSSSRPLPLLLMRIDSKRAAMRFCVRLVVLEDDWEPDDLV